MPIEFDCFSCSSKLKVPDEFAGKTAKCPKCSSLNTIPDGGSAFDPLEPLQMPTQPMDSASPSGGMDFSSPIEPMQQTKNPYSSAGVSAPRPAPRRRHGTLTLRRVDIGSAALMFAGFYVVVGLFYLVITVFFASLGIALADGRGVGSGIGFALIGVVFVPVFFGIGGAIAGAIFGVIYNIVAHFVGGLKFETD